jgi:rSAM/selenodomain-associated transferase 1
VKPECAIILMAKQPQAGKTKTRLCPPFSPEEAAELYEALLKDTLALAGGLEEVQMAVAISPPESLGYFEQIAPPGTLLLQVQGANIGVCLEQSFVALLQRGYQKVLALNTDGPSLPREYLLQAIQMLDTHDLVLGPSDDGGYYVVGLKERLPAIFENITWSTGTVLSRTLEQAQKLRLRVALTPPWYDVDSPADVRRLLAELIHQPAAVLRHTRHFFNQHLSESRQA